MICPAREIDQSLHETSTAKQQVQGGSVSEPGSNAQLAFCDILALQRLQEQRPKRSVVVFIDAAKLHNCTLCSHDPRTISAAKVVAAEQ